VDDNGLDVARALYRDLTGQTVRRSKQVDGRRTFVVEPYDPSASIKYFWRGELSAHAWLRSFKGRKEFDWEDALPFLMAWGRLAIRALSGLGRSDLMPPAARISQYCKPAPSTPNRSASGYARAICFGEPSLRQKLLSRLINERYRSLSFCSVAI
jgi:hypothetical protein